MAITFEALSGVLSLSTSQWTSSLESARRNLQRFRDHSAALMRQVGDAARTTAQAIGAVAAAAGAAAAASVKVGGDFEQGMSRVKALLSASSKDLEGDFQRLTAQARQLGETTVFSARQAGEAMQFFALAGFDAQKIMASMPDTLDLAAAGAMDVGRAADIAAKIMAGMGLSSDELGHAVDVLAKAFTTANTDLSQLGEAMKYVGPVAKAAGLPLEQVVATIQIMSDAGIQASMAGTSLRGILSHLASGSSETRKVFESLGVAFKNTDGSMRPLPDLIDDFNRALAQQGREGERAGLVMQAFGARAGPAMIELLSAGGDKLREYQQRLADAGGTAQRIAGIQLDNLRGSFTLLGSAIEGLQIRIGDRLSPRIREAVDWTTSWLNLNQQIIEQRVERYWDMVAHGAERAGKAIHSAVETVRRPVARLAELSGQVYETGKKWFAALPEGTQNALTAAAALVGLGTALSTVGSGLPFIGGLAAAVGAAINPVVLLGGAVGMLGNGMMAAAGIAQSLGAASAWLAGLLGTGLVGVLSAVIDKVLYLGLFALSTLRGKFGLAMQSASGLLGALGSLGKLIGGLVLTGGPIALLLSAVAAIVAGLGTAIARSQQARDAIGPAFKTIAEWGKALIDGVLRILSDFWETNRWRIERLGVQLSKLFSGAIGEGKPVAEFLGMVLAKALELVLGLFLKVTEALSAVIDMFNGDFRKATSLANQFLASMARALAVIVEGLKAVAQWLGFSGEAFDRASASLRDYAARKDDVSAKIERELELEHKAAEQRAESLRIERQNAENLAEFKRRQAEEQARRDREAAKAAQAAAEAASEADLGHPVVPGIGAAGLAGAPTGGWSAGMELGGAGGFGRFQATGGASGKSLQQMSDEAVAAEQEKARQHFEMLVRGGVGVLAQETLKMREQFDAGLRMLASSGMGVTRQDIRQLNALRDQALNAMKQVRNSTGETRRAHLEELQKIKDAWAKTFAAIRSGSKETAESQTKDLQNLGKQAEATAGQFADAAQEQIGQAARAVTGTTGGGGIAGQSMIGSLMGGVAAIGNQLSSLFTQSISSMGAASARFAGFVAQITDPIEQLNLAIDNVNARLAGAMVNIRLAGGGDAVVALRQELSRLETRRNQLLGQSQSERNEALERSRAEFARQRAIRLNLDNERANEARLDTQGLVSVGASAPISIQINGVNDVREAFDRIEAELRRRGYNRSGKRGGFVRS